MHPAALIVTHGQPSDPAPAEAELALLAARVAGHLPGWQVGSATLAGPGALAAAVAQLGPAGLVYPLFMACGWFTRTHLPARLAGAGGAGWHILPPFGCDAGVQALAVTIVQESAAARGLAPADTSVLLAAHGSFRSPAPAQIADAVAARIAAAGFGRAEAAFIDQSPQIAGAVGFGAASLCLPFFAAGGAHVSDDIPQALAACGFGGHLLPPVGRDSRVPGLIARALQDRQENPALACAGTVCAAG
nr:cobalamin biosynthesis protein CbiX [Fertoeibacter niger]